MHKMLRYALLGLMWGAVAGYVVWAAVASARARSGVRVGRVEIRIEDSTAQGQLVLSESVREWISQSGIPVIGTAVDAVDLTGIERLIARNGFVDRVAAYVTAGGTLHVGIRPRRPLLRLMTDRMNSYVTAGGYVFAAPRASSLYVQVVTGSYRPPFPADYAGDVRSQVDRSKRELDARIAALEKEKYPFYRREIENDRNTAALRRMRIKRRWWRLESARDFDLRVERLRKEKARLRRLYRYEARLIQQEIDRLGERQQTLRGEQKKLEKSYVDFMKLLTFVERVEDDDFWRSEVVQIAAHTTSSGALEVELTPRSGPFTILFGRIEEVDRKFDRLMRFYRKGLPKIGWNEYRTIDVRYRDQVVCRK